MEHILHGPHVNTFELNTLVLPGAAAMTSALLSGSSAKRKLEQEQM